MFSGSLSTLRRWHSERRFFIPSRGRIGLGATKVLSILIVQKIFFSRLTSLTGWFKVRSKETYSRRQQQTTMMTNATTMTIRARAPSPISIQYSTFKPAKFCTLVGFCQGKTLQNTGRNCTKDVVQTYPVGPRRRLCRQGPQVVLQQKCLKTSTLRTSQYGPPLAVRTAR